MPFDITSSKNIEYRVKFLINFNIYGIRNILELLNPADNSNVCILLDKGIPFVT